MRGVLQAIVVTVVTTICAGAVFAPAMQPGGFGQPGGRPPIISSQPYIDLATTPVGLPSLEPGTEETVLWSAGLKTDSSALLEFFHARVKPAVDSDKLLAVARTLGDPDPEIRAKASSLLIGCGPCAIPPLRRVLNDLEDRFASENAKSCLDFLEGNRRADVPIAAARMLARQKPAGACEALLAYLPVADDGTVVDNVKGALLSLAKTPGQPHAALVKALHDPVALRRAVAVEVLAGSGQQEAFPEVRKLLSDPKPEVRMRAGLALAQQLDEQAIGVLIDLLADVAVADRKQIEEMLQGLAGDWSPNPTLSGDDEVARKIRRAAWAGWWQSTDGPTLLAAFQKRTLSGKELDRVLGLIDKLGDKTFAVRERAAADLAAMGLMVKALLEQAAKSPDLERARRAELCLKQIQLHEDKHKLPVAAARLLAVRKPPQATETLLAFLPFCDDERMKEEIGKGLKIIAVAAGKPEPILLKSLSDSMPFKRAIAAEAVAGLKDHWPAVRKLLKDEDPAVRLRAAAALVFGQDRDAVPALIDLAAELPRDQAWQAQELLHRLAGAKAPPLIASDDAAARKKFQADWHAWWKAEGASVDLAKLEASPTVQGLTLITEFNNNTNSGRVVELDRRGKPIWQIDNVQFAIDVRILPGNRVLVLELYNNRVSERDFKGNIHWQINNLNFGNPANAQRLPNGNTFVVFYGGPMVEYDKNGKSVFQFNVPNGARAGGKLPNGQIVCLTQQNLCIRLDASGKELKNFAVSPINNALGAVDLTPQNTILVPHSDQTLKEYDLDGKVVWQIKSPGGTITTASRILNGHTLIVCNNNAVFEVDRAGRVVWEYRAQPGYQLFRARQR